MKPLLALITVLSASFAHAGEAESVLFLQQRQRERQATTGTAGSPSPRSIPAVVPVTIPHQTWDGYLANLKRSGGRGVITVGYYLNGDYDEFSVPIFEIPKPADDNRGVLISSLKLERLPAAVIVELDADGDAIIRGRVYGDPSVYGYIPAKALERRLASTFSAPRVTTGTGNAGDCETPPPSVSSWDTAAWDGRQAVPSTTSVRRGLRRAPGAWRSPAFSRGGSCGPSG